MPKTQQFSPRLNLFMPAILRRNKGMGYFVEYYAYNPISDKLERRRIRLNQMKERYRTVAEFKVAANKICCDINSQLAGGWSPFGTSDNVRYYTTIEEVLEKYISEKERELKPESLRSYKSFVRQFGSWCTKNIPNCKCINFNRTLAVRYLDDYYSKSKVTGRTYNNMLKLSRAFFSWAVQKCYCKENPFETMKNKKEERKTRIIIDADSRKRIREYFEDRQPNFLVVLELVYFSLLRPIEVSRVKVKYIDLQQSVIHMPATDTKNGYARDAVLSDELCDRIGTMIQYASGEDYLISFGYTCGKHSLSRKMYQKVWDKMRKELKLPKEMQLYSLRDTGINSMLLAGIPDLTVMQAADHHDLSITTRYANHTNIHLVETIKKQTPVF